MCTKMEQQKAQTKKVTTQGVTEKYRQNRTAHHSVEIAKVSSVIQMDKQVITMVRVPVNTRANTCKMFLAVCTSDRWKL